MIVLKHWIKDSAKAFSWCASLAIVKSWLSMCVSHSKMCSTPLCVGSVQVLWGQLGTLNWLCVCLCVNRFMWIVKTQQAIMAKIRNWFEHSELLTWYSRVRSSPTNIKPTITRKLLESFFRQIPLNVKFMCANRNPLHLA